MVIDKLFKWQYDCGINKHWNTAQGKHFVKSRCLVSIAAYHQCIVGIEYIVYKFATILLFIALQVEGVARIA